MLRFSIVVAPILPGLSHAAIVNVSPGSGLQAAIDAATAGDTLLLADGTYTAAPGTASGVATATINKDLTIRAVNNRQAIITGENARSHPPL